MELLSKDEKSISVKYSRAEWEEVKKACRLSAIMAEEKIRKIDSIKEELNAMEAEMKRDEEISKIRQRESIEKCLANGLKFQQEQERRKAMMEVRP